MAREKGAKNPNLVVGIAIAVVVIACVVGYFAWQGAQTESEGSGTLVARAHDGDGGTTELALDGDGTTTIASSLGENVVVVKDGAVHVESATCDNKDCVHQGEISQPGQQIICLPNKMWIEVVHEGDSDGTMDPGKTAEGSSGSGSSFDATAR